MYVAVDIGGTKTLVARLSEDGRIEHSVKHATDEAFDDFINRLIEALRAEFITEEVKGLAVAVPGRVDYETGAGVIFGNLNWRNAPIAQRLSEAFNLPVVVDNDANVAGLAEARALEPTPPTVVYVTISTGIGTGIILDGSTDNHLRQSEGGFMHFEFEDKLQAWEDFASGRAIKDRYGTYAKDLEDDAAWRSIGYNIALGLSNIAALIQPDAIILGGSIGHYLPKYQDYLSESMQKLKEKMYALPPVLQAKHPEDAVIYGCYYLLQDKLGG